MISVRKPLLLVVACLSLFLLAEHAEAGLVRPNKIPEFAGGFLLNPAGAISDTYTYDAYGMLVASTASTANNYLYTGEQFDADLGFYYLRARYLDPDIGRFQTMDSFGGVRYDPVSLHKYLYAGSDPINGLDPLGLMTLSEVLGSLGIEKQVNKAVGQLLKNAARRQARKIGCEIVKDQVVSGIYVIVLDGALYVGQSGNIAQRIAGWTRQGAKFVGALSITTGMPKGPAEKFVREIIEQTRSM